MIDPAYVDLLLFRIRTILISCEFNEKNVCLLFCRNLFLLVLTVYLRSHPPCIFKRTWMLSVYDWDHSRILWG
jgi:hypothetical protein